MYVCVHNFKNTYTRPKKTYKLQMEEVMSMIFHGMKLVKRLESSLPEKPPESLSTSLDEIAKTFDDANERLKMFLEIRNSETVLNQTKPVVVSVSNQMLVQMEPGLTMQEYWLRCGGSTSSQGAEAMFHTQLMAVDGGGGRKFTEGSGASGSSTPRQRRRKDEGEEQTVLVAALRTGNTDMPPDDNHTWRKYGQKEILGSRFPRAYYRCTHQKLYNCPAKKQVQRLNDDPFTFRVTYRGSHTCHIYSIAPISSATVTATTATGHSIDYGSPIRDMTDAMFGSSGIGANMDFIFPFNDPPHRFRRLDDDGDGHQ
ncbi:PREDICTED: WRKY transcription factor 55-like [Camelina sativa]|uniref:WRKY transcription factor 55-like n=1 Tax=Camelina sativa TaxID=90675 RepID=A0ABM0YTY1_CAMSA|nr:PREDICTED: WRKY transcription factor 55-like [Camelina sativa]